MEKIVIISFIISALYYAVKYVENRILYKPPPLGPGEEAPELPSLKPIFRDTILIFICSICSIFAVEQLTPIIMTMMDGVSTGYILDSGSPRVFTGQPGF